eukprot:NODE_110_length_19453_cov_0.364369.p2 type:complete len:491 gc:universal NODE_110_length_19453_cov_0.364369:12192-13664(+)
MDRNLFLFKQVIQISKDYKRNYVKNGDNHELHLRGANELLKIAEHNRGVYIKIGQHISSLVYLVPDEYISTLSVLQDRCPQSDLASIGDMVKEETGKPLSELFKGIERIPIGTGSLAQVHRCNEFAVKFQHPSLVKYAEQDMYFVSKVAKFIKYAFPSFNLMWLSEEMNHNLPNEMDFRIEAENSERLRGNFFGHRYKVMNEPSFNNFCKYKCNQLPSFGGITKVLKIPKIHFATKRVLCMEFMQGAKLNDSEYLRAHRIEPHQVARSLSYLFGNMIFVNGFDLHCDPHLGNIMIQSRPYKSFLHSFYNYITGTPNFYLILLDHGLYRELSTTFRSSYAYLWRALVSGNEDDIKSWSFKVGGVDSYRLFSSMLTGRSWETITTESLNSERTAREQAAIARANIYIEDIASILATVPRELLLILKTNDLLRNADYYLNCGPYFSYFTLMRLVNYNIYRQELNYFRFIQQDLKWRFYDYSLGLYYSMRNSFK